MLVAARQTRSSRIPMTSMTPKMLAPGEVIDSEPSALRFQE